MSLTAASSLLAFIRETETGFSDSRAYDTMYGHKKITPVLTKMSLDQAIAAGPSWTKAHKSSAAGAYQFMNATLKDLKASNKLPGSMVLTPSEQDKLGYALLKRRGFEKFIAGEMTMETFGKALAQEWASFPVLAATKGAHQQVKRGQSYYAGDALNRALVKPEKVEEVLRGIKKSPQSAEPTATNKPAEPTPSNSDLRKQDAAFTPLIALVAVVILIIAVLVISFKGG